MSQSNAHPTEIGKYKILSVLGRGGMGTVYRALDPVIDRTVAVKTISIQQEGIDASQVERLLMEARSAGRLHHNNIVTVFDFGQAADTAYIVLELVEGVDLGQIITGNQPLALPQKIDLILQICQGLGFAHDRGVTHRDMKPSNVRVTTDGTAKILDFGLARFDDTQLTKSGFISGTIAYMSPERINGQTGMSDDIFALGASAYELLTYRRAFPGATTPEVMFKILTEPPPAPSTVAELPVELDPVILKSLSREPRDRYASAHDFAAALEEAFESDGAQRFVTDPARSEAFKAALLGWTPRRRTRDTRSRTMARVTTQPDDAPTQVMSSDPALLNSTATSVDRSPSAGAMTVTDLPADKTVVSHPMAAPPTQLVEKPKSKFALVAILVLIVGAAAAAGILLTGGDDSSVPTPPDGGTASNSITTASASMAPITDTSLVVTPQGTMGTVGTMLNAPVPQPAETTGQTAPPVPQPKPKPAPPIDKPADTRPKPKPQPPSPAPAPVPQPREDTPVPVPQPVPQPPPQPVPQPVPQPEKPATDPREEITSFMRRVARAYESRDSGFFRDNHLGYTDAMGNAVRNSPSKSVRLEIVSISLPSPSQARVLVERTDEFAGATAPAKQRLTFVLERDGSEWKIRRFERP